MVPDTTQSARRDDDRAGPQYWEKHWSDGTLAKPVDPGSIPLRKDPTRAFHDAFRELFHDRPTKGARLLEIGAANSAWLPYFAREYGFRVSGIDYSARGCEQAREILRRAGVDGTVTCTDALAPPPELREAFDVVVSFGVVEHFDDPAAALRAFRRYLKPGATLITIIPNIAGAVGWVTRLLNRPVWETHVPLTSAELERAHERAGLRVESARYFEAINFGVVNLAGKDPSAAGTRLARGVLRALFRLSELCWLVERSGVPLPTTRVLSPYIFCVAVRPPAEPRPGSPLMQHAHGDVPTAEEVYSQEREVGRRAAPLYDAAYESPYWESERGVFARGVATHARHNGVDLPTARVLEIGTGTGLLIPHLQRIGIETLVCNDLSEDMLQVAELRFPGVAFDLGPVETLGYEPASFDLVVGFSVLHHLPDLRSFFAWLAGVLQPGGIFAFADGNDRALLRRRFWKWVVWASVYPVQKPLRLLNRSRLEEIPSLEESEYYSEAHRALTREEVVSSLPAELEATLSTHGILAPAFNNALAGRRYEGALLRTLRALDRALPFEGTELYTFGRLR
jgi:SAM-dependent methyltransferase